MTDGTIRRADGDLPPPGSPARRRLGILLVVFGAVGILLVGSAFLVAAQPVAADVGPFGIEAQRRQFVRFLDATATAIDSAERAAQDADGSLGDTAVAAESAATLMSDLSVTLDAFAASLRISVLGTQPFAPAANDMERVADQAGTVSADLDVAASSVRIAGEDMAALAADLAEIRAELDEIRRSVANPIEAEGWRLLVAAMLLWLAVPAIVSLWIGLRWLRPVRPAVEAERRDPRPPEPRPRG